MPETGHSNSAEPHLYFEDAGYAWRARPVEWAQTAITDMRVALDISRCRSYSVEGLSEPEKRRVTDRARHANSSWNSVSHEVRKTIGEFLELERISLSLAKLDVDYGARLKEVLETVPLEDQAAAIRALNGTEIGLQAKAKKAALTASRFSQRPEIQIEAGERNNNVSSIATVLGTSGKYFSRGGQLIRLATFRVEETDENGVVRAAGSIAIKPAEVATIVADVSKAAITKKFNARKGAYVKADLPADVAQSVKEIAAEDASIKPLLGVVQVPILRPDGAIEAVRGYDVRTRLYLAADVDLDVPNRPTHEQAKEAARWLVDEIYGEFKTDEIGRSVMLSSLLTSVLRPYLNGSPLHAFSAPSWGAGKSKLAEIAGIVAMGVHPPLSPPGETKEETMKRVESAIRSGDSINVLDNVSHPLTGDALCVMLTAAVVSIRIFGTNTTAKYETACFWMATGQNLTIGGDLVRRSVLAVIDPGVERPELSNFKKPELVGWVKENRLEILSKLYLILRAHAQAGFPHGEGSPPRLGSFSDWAKRVAGLITWLGYKSPKASQDFLYEDDPVRMRRMTLIDAIYDWQELDAAGNENNCRATPGKPWTAKELFDAATSDIHGNKMLADFLKSDLKAGATSHSLGNYLRRIRGQITGGKRLIQFGSDPSTKVALWIVEVTDSSCIASIDDAPAHVVAEM